MSEDKKSRKSFDVARQEKIDKLTKQIENDKARLAKHEKDLAEVIAKTERAKRPMQEKTKTKKFGELLAKSGMPNDKIAEMLRDNGIDIPEELL